MIGTATHLNATVELLSIGTIEDNVSNPVSELAIFGSSTPSIIKRSTRDTKVK